MRVIGIDPGLVRTGWAVIEPAASRARVCDHGLISPPSQAELAPRLAEGAQQLRAVLATHRPALAALEEIFTAPRHPKSALLMAHMRGVICLVIAEAGVPILPLTATTVKQRLTGSGHASKQQLQRMVLQLTGLEPGRGLRWDVTDAIALALAGLHQLTNSGSVSTPQQRRAYLAELAGYHSESARGSTSSPRTDPSKPHV